MNSCEILWYPIRYLIQTLQNDTNNTPMQHIMFIQKSMQQFWINLQETDEVFKMDTFSSLTFTSASLQALPEHFDRSSTVLILKDIFSSGNLIHICLCMTVINEFKKFQQMNNDIDSKQITDWFMLQSEKLQSTCEHSTILLSAAQLETTMQLLLTIYVEELDNNVLLKQSRQFALQRLEWCVTKLEAGFTKDSEIQTDEVPGNFMLLMDTVLEYVADIDVDSMTKESIILKYNLAKNEIDELLCHAMSIAQVALSEDLKRIKSGSCKVINLCAEVLKECSENTPDQSLCNLLLDSLTDALCLVEERVNTAVLQLLLEVFQNSEGPLKDLYKFCTEPDKLIKERQGDDLNDLIIKFDLHVDRIIQIGLFAIACSTDRERVLMMRNCLASLESLEGELVPALTTLYLEPEFAPRLHVMILCKHWYDEVNILQNLIHFIVDPTAFSKVVLEVCKSEVEKIQHLVNKKHQIINSDTYISISRRAWTLVKHLKTCLPEIKSQLSDDCIKHITSLSDILKECDCAIKVLLNDDVSSIVDTKRVLKRFTIMVHSISQLQTTLTQFDNEQRVSRNETNLSSIGLKEKGTNFKQEIETSKPPQSLALLMLRGEVLRKERSILYQTPKKSKMAIMPIRISSTESRKASSICRNKTEITQVSIKNDSFSFNITDILDKISNLHISTNSN